MQNPLTEESTVYVIHINTSLGRRPEEKSEHLNRWERLGLITIGRFEQQHPRRASSLRPAPIRSAGRTQGSPGRHVAQPFPYFQQLLCTYPRTSNELISNYISTEMHNVIRSFIYLFFHFASALTDDCSNPSIRSEG